MSKSRTLLKHFAPWWCFDPLDIKIPEGSKAPLRSAIELNSPKAAVNFSFCMTCVSYIRLLKAAKALEEIQSHIGYDDFLSSLEFSFVGPWIGIVLHFGNISRSGNGKRNILLQKNDLIYCLILLSITVISLIISVFSSQFMELFVDNSWIFTVQDLKKCHLFILF